MIHFLVKPEVAPLRNRTGMLVFLLVVLLYSCTTREVITNQTSGKSSFYYAVPIDAEKGILSNGVFNKERYPILGMSYWEGFEAVKEDILSVGNKDLLTAFSQCRKKIAHHAASTMLGRHREWFEEVKKSVRNVNNRTIRRLPC